LIIGDGAPGFKIAAWHGAPQVTMVDISFEGLRTASRKSKEKQSRLGRDDNEAHGQASSQETHSREDEEL
jgi:hypothetical protein